MALRYYCQGNRAYRTFFFLPTQESINESTDDINYYYVSYTPKHLDISELTIEDVSLRLEGGSTPVNHFISDFVENIGSKLVIELPTKTSGE